VEGEEWTRERTSARLHGVGVINQRDQKIQYFNTSIRVAVYSGVGSKFDDEEQARVLKWEDCGAFFSQDKGDVTLNG